MFILLDIFMILKEWNINQDRANFTPTNWKGDTSHPVMPQVYTLNVTWYLEPWVAQDNLWFGMKHKI